MLSLFKHQQEALIELCLSQVDRVGKHLSDHEITDQVNRHQLVAVAFMQKNRLDGERSRFALQVSQRLQPLKKLQSSLDEHIDKVIDYLPEPVAMKAHQTHEFIKLKRPF